MSEVQRTITINEGPDYNPNGKRIVAIIGPADVPGFTRCRDVKTGQVVIIKTAKIERANANGQPAS
jgi:hypothetical protein